MKHKKEIQTFGFVSGVGRIVQLYNLLGGEDTDVV